jgi:hypothetical protein
MRARRLRPSFDTLSQRITPSDLTVAAPPVSSVATDAMPGSTTTIDPGTWTQPTNVLHPVVNPASWVAATQS